jgi:hypothetical protein
VFLLFGMLVWRWGGFEIPPSVNWESDGAAGTPVGSRFRENGLTNRSQSHGCDLGWCFEAMRAQTGRILALLSRKVLTPDFA